MKLIILILLFVAIFTYGVNCGEKTENEGEEGAKKEKEEQKVTLFGEPCGNFPLLKQLKETHDAIEKHMKKFDFKNFAKFTKLVDSLRHWGSQHYNCCEVLDKQFMSDYPLLHGYTVDMDKVEQVLNYYRNMMNAKFGFVKPIIVNYIEVLKHHITNLERKYIIKDLNFVEDSLRKLESVEVGHFDCIRDSDLHQGIRFATNHVPEDDPLVNLLNEKFGLNTPKLKKQNKSMGSESVLKPSKSERSTRRSQLTNEKSEKSVPQKKQTKESLNKNVLLIKNASKRENNSSRSKKKYPQMEKEPRRSESKSSSRKPPSEGNDDEDEDESSTATVSRKSQRSMVPPKLTEHKRSEPKKMDAKQSSSRKLPSKGNDDDEEDEEDEEDEDEEDEEDEEEEDEEDEEEEDESSSATVSRKSQRNKVPPKLNEHKRSEPKKMDAKQSSSKKLPSKGGDSDEDENEDEESESSRATSSKKSQRNIVKQKEVPFKKMGGNHSKSKQVHFKEPDESESKSQSASNASRRRVSQPHMLPPRRGTSIEGEAKRRQVKEVSESSVSRSLGGQSVHSESIKKLSKPVPKQKPRMESLSMESDSTASSSIPARRSSKKT